MNKAMTTLLKRGLIGTVEPAVLKEATVQQQCALALLYVCLELDPEEIERKIRERMHDVIQKVKNNLLEETILN